MLPILGLRVNSLEFLGAGNSVVVIAAMREESDAGVVERLGIERAGGFTSDGDCCWPRTRAVR